MEEIKKIPQREEIPLEDKWATEDLFASDEIWEAELAKIPGYQEQAVAYAGKLGESGTNLYEALYLGEQISEKIGLLANYAMRKADEDTRNSHYQAMVGKFYSIKDEDSIKKGTIISTVFAVVVAGGCYFLGGFGKLYFDDMLAAGQRFPHRRRNYPVARDNGCPGYPQHP